MYYGVFFIFCAILVHPDFLHWELERLIVMHLALERVVLIHNEGEDKTALERVVHNEGEDNNE